MTDIIIPADRAANHGGDKFREGGDKFTETFVVLGDLTEHDRVLDIGCGPGRMAIGIGERFRWKNHLIGFDVIQVDVAVATEHISARHPNFQFHHLNAWNGHYNPKGTLKSDEIVFPVADNSIDFAFATSVFTHMFKKDIIHYLKEVRRVLSPGGRLLSTWFAMPDAAFAATREEKARFTFKHLQDDGSFIERPKSPEDVVGYRYDDIIDMFHQAGLSDNKFYQGGWSRTETVSPRHSQDIFVSRV